MGALPVAEGSLLVRTCAGHGEAWAELLESVKTETADGFRAFVDFVDDPEWFDKSHDYIRMALPKGDALVLFMADAEALTGEGFPILVVDLGGEFPPFRCVASELWAVDNNLNIANMDFDEFAGATGTDGVFRGFPVPTDDSW